MSERERWERQYRRDDDVAARRARDLWALHHAQCEAFDRSIVPHGRLPDDRGFVRLLPGRELSRSAEYARGARERVLRAARVLEIDSDVLEAARRDANRMRAAELDELAARASTRCKELMR